MSLNRGISLNLYLLLLLNQKMVSGKTVTLSRIVTKFSVTNSRIHCTTKHMKFGPECKTRVSAAQSSFGSKAKMSVFSPNIFPTFYQFPGRFSLTLQHIKNLEVRFSVSANYHRFWLLTWPKMKNFAFSIKCHSILFQKELF